ncbi:MAG: DUF5652 family protein [Patescibacteria group bacterium]
MYGEYFNLIEFSSMPAPIFTLVVIAAIWSIIWKGIALWKAGKNGSKPWFIALLVINTMGLLEIIYIFFFNKKGKNN